LVYQRPLYGIATLFLWMKVFYFMRIFRDVGHLVRMIFQIIRQMRFFFIVFAMFIFAFSTTFYVLMADSSDQSWT